MVDASPARRRNFADHSFAAPIFRSELARLKLFLHFVDVSPGQIDLVDRNHDLDVRRRFGVIDRFDRLRHYAVVRRDNKHDDVGNVRAPRAHCGKCRVARRVDERDLLSFVFDAVSADVLSNSTGFARRHARFANRVHQ